jgi:3-deoxy-D-manno-octulosonate 8-phosphate phosphatase (KDO 8-P phosphatase)
MINFNIISKLKNSKIKLLILDVDGCMTNGQVSYISDDQNIIFSIYDGEAIKNLIKKINIIVISGRSCKGTLFRCKELGIPENNIFLDCKNKDEILKKYLLNNNNIKKENIIMIGDQTSDLCLVDLVNILVCPRNTPDFEVIKKSDYITFTNGGTSAIFELYKLIEHFLD